MPAAGTRTPPMRHIAKPETYFAIEPVLGLYQALGRSHALGATGQYCVVAYSADRKAVAVVRAQRGVHPRVHERELLDAYRRAAQQAQQHPESDTTNWQVSADHLRMAGLPTVIATAALVTTFVPVAIVWNVETGTIAGAAAAAGAFGAVWAASLTTFLRHRARIRRSTKDLLAFVREHEPPPEPAVYTYHENLWGLHGPLNR